MEKEVLSRERLINNAYDSLAVTRMKSMIRAPYRGIVNSSLDTPMESWISSNLGEFGVKVIGVSDGAENLERQDITALGGWCAVRTKDLSGIAENGTIFNPSTGKESAFSSTAEITDWIKRAVSIDQVVDSIGMYLGDNYAAISEEKLWSDRLIGVIEKRLKRQLSGLEKQEVEDAMQEAEKMRFEYTKRYLQFASGRDINLTRVVDRDIFDGLLEVRDEMLDTAGLPFPVFKRIYPNEGTQNYSIVWGMYTGLYFDLLKRSGYVTTPKGIIIEPWWHAFNENNDAKIDVNSKIFGFGSNLYLGNAGINKNLGYIAFTDVMDGKGDRYRSGYSINEVPNKENYKSFLEKLLGQPDCMNLDLRKNPAFVWGVNLLPLGVTASLLNKMVDTKDAWQNEKVGINSSSQSKQEKIQAVADARARYKKGMGDLASLVISELERMLIFVFE